MTDREILELVLSKMDHMESQINAIQTDIQETKSDIENVTNKNLNLIAENYVSLAKRFNENIKVIDQTLAYQIKISFLSDEIDQLKKEVEKLPEPYRYSQNQ